MQVGNGAFASASADPLFLPLPENSKEKKQLFFFRKHALVLSYPSPNTILHDLQSANDSNTVGSRAFFYRKDPNRVRRDMRSSQEHLFAPRERFCFNPLKSVHLCCFDYSLFQAFAN